MNYLDLLIYIYIYIFFFFFFFLTPFFISPSPSKRPFPSSPRPLFQYEIKCPAFDMEMILYSHANETHFHKKVCVLGLIFESECFWDTEVAD